MKKVITLMLISSFVLSCQSEKTNEKKIINETKNEYTSDSYDDLVDLFHTWREFEHPPLLEGAPDYRASTFEKRWPLFKELQSNLQSIDTSNWPIPQQIDWEAAHFRPEFMNFDVPRNIYIHICGTDLVRDRSGKYLVLEDNARCPSGVSYVLENRQAMKRIFPTLHTWVIPPAAICHTSETRPPVQTWGSSTDWSPLLNVRTSW